MRLKNESTTLAEDEAKSYYLNELESMASRTIHQLILLSRQMKAPTLSFDDYTKTAVQAENIEFDIKRYYYKDTDGIQLIDLTNTQVNFTTKRGNPQQIHYQ